MQNPPPNRNQRSSPKYFSQLALAATLGDESQIHGAPTVRQRRRIGLDQNALISLAVIFSVVLISVLVVGIYNSQSTAKALPARETKDYSAQDLTQKVGASQKLCLATKPKVRSVKQMNRSLSMYQEL
ncbi:hypothetical protein [Arcanobacterium hippocoleae]|uniref:hypothetical protein n=1 Tax=Arcanobacterium hippocoleae TaxID=149017 RepID=UPI00333EE209